MCYSPFDSSAVFEVWGHVLLSAERSRLGGQRSQARHVYHGPTAVRVAGEPGCHMCQTVSANQ